MVEDVEKIIKKVSPYYQKKGGPEAEHKLVYDSATEQLEAIYYFILDMMNDFGLNTEKLTDNFASSPGSSHFGELGQRSSIMQQQGTQLMERVNSVARSVLNIIYDLRDFQTRLEHYDNLKSNDQLIKDSARLALKQIYMDKVDIQKGQSSLKAMATQGGFPMMIDAFLAVDSVKDVENVDLNDRIKRILKPRIQDFNAWLDKSEKELRKRYDMERNYLKSQVNSLKLYSRWAKPYLKAAHKLEQKDQGTNPDIVNTFNTLILELTLLGKSQIKVKDVAKSGDIPYEFTKKKYLKMFNREYFSCILVDFYFRGIPKQIDQKGQYSFGGKSTVTFKAYSLNEEELKKVKEEMEKSEIGDALKTIEGVTSESLERLEEDIQEFLSDIETDHILKKKKGKKERNEGDQSNPFIALIGGYNKKSKNSPKKKKNEKISKDSWAEKTYLRSLAAQRAKDTAFSLFDVYKKSHGMPSYT